MPSGTRLIPVREIERFLYEHADVGLGGVSPRRRAGRRSSVSPKIVERIRREHAEDKSLAEIARRLTASGTPTPPGRTALVALNRTRHPRTLTEMTLRQPPSPFPSGPTSALS